MYWKEIKVGEKMTFRMPFLNYLRTKLSKELVGGFHAPETKPGCVVSGRSRDRSPNGHHWFRDAAFCVLSLMQSSDVEEDEQRHLLLDWLSFEAECARNIDADAELSSAGEPKAHTDASAFSDPCARPQRDASALRICAGLQALDRLHRQGLTVQAELQFDAVMARDIRYTASNVGSLGFDLWEQVYEVHFFTLSAQCYALSCALSSRWVDGELKESCSAALQTGEEMMQQYMDDISHQPFVPSIQHYKSSTQDWCDSSTLLAVCKFRKSMLLSPQVIGTVLHLANQFSHLYPINQNYTMPLLGRYAEDKYCGGNPWPLCSCFAIEWCYMTASHLFMHQQQPIEKRTAKALLELFGRFGQPIQHSDRQHLVKGLISIGDAWFERLLDQISTTNKKHSVFKANLRCSEQIDRSTGRWLSAERFTWAYAALLDCVNARIAIENSI